MSREDVWITVLQREFTKKDRGATEQEIDEFWIEVHAINPAIIVPLGNESLRLVLGDWASMELCAGLPHRAPVDTHVLLPFPHPGGINYIGMAQGFEALARYLEGSLRVHQVDSAPVYYGEFNKDSLRFDLPQPFYLSDVATIDTEGSVEHPWCLTFSWGDRVAGLIRATETEQLAAFQRSLDEQCPTVVMHYAPHDLRVLNAMGVHINPTIKVLDTMQLAYIAGRMPQGLKTLAYRLCGMRMRDYADLVGPHEERIATQYLQSIEDVFRPAHPKDKKHPVYKAIQRCWKSKRGARALWMDQQPEILTAASEAVMGKGSTHWHAGPMPNATLDDVPFEEVLQYACADADATRRVFFKLREYFD